MHLCPPVPPVREGNGREAAIAFAPVGWIAREGSDDKLGIRLDCSGRPTARPPEQHPQ